MSAPAPAGVLGQRLPFLLPVVAAVAGILLGSAGGIPAWVAGCGGAGLLLMAILRADKGWGVWWLGGGIALSFVALQAWRAYECPGVLLAGVLAEPMAIEGVVLIEGAPADWGGGRWAAPARLEAANVQGSGMHPGLRVWVEGLGELPGVGQRLRMRGSLSAIKPPRNPGSFDQREWLGREGIHLRLQAQHPSDIAVLAGREVGWPGRWAEAVHAWILRTLQEGVDAGAAPTQLVVAMTVGEVGPVEPGLLEDFRATGTYHLFSVSGLHVGMLGTLLWLVLGTLRVPRPATAMVILPSLFFYALVTGWKPASVRAATMAAFVVVGILVGRPSVILNSLLAAGFAILLMNPGELFNTGFQLSFVVVVGLILLVPWVAGRIGKALAVDPFIPLRIYSRGERWRAAMVLQVAPLVAVSLVAWVVSMPLTAGAFHMVSLVAVPANMVCVPMAFAIMAVAMMSLVGGLVGGTWLAALFNNANTVLASMLIAVVELAAGLPFHAVPVAAWDPAPARMTVLDFGSGGGAVLEAGGEVWLIDCGPLYEGRRTLVPFLRMRGVVRPRGLVLTHGDARHVGGAGVLLEQAVPMSVLASGVADRSPTRKALAQALADRGIPVDPLVAGDRVPLGLRGEIQVLFPPAGFVAATADDGALVVMVVVDGWRVLLLSDAGAATEAWLVEHARERLACDVVVKGAHRSGNMPSAALWDAARPGIVVATHSAFPPAEALTEATLRDLEARRVVLFRQDATGAVTLRFYDGCLEVEGFLGGKARLERAGARGR